MFYGKPAVAWSIEAALWSYKFDKVLLSTDSEKIAEIGIEYGAHVPFLRNRASDDHSSSSEATLAALDQAEEYWGKRFSVVAQLMANCPLRESQHVCAAMNAFSENNASSQISCFRFGWMNPWWAAKLALMVAQIGFSRRLNCLGLRICLLYCPSGALWVAKVQSLRTFKSFYSPDQVFNVMDWMSAMDIDDEEDWAMAEACKALRQSNEK